MNKSELKSNKVNVLFPGKFKPFTDGHYSLIGQYLQSAQTNKVIIIISNKPKNNIDAKSSYSFIKNIFKSNPRVEVVIADTPSPVGKCFDIVTENPGIYAMASSSKDDDANRTSYFEKYFAEGGKGYNEATRIVKYPMDVQEPAIYKGRTDGNDGAIISATQVRKDIANDDKKSFIAGYRKMLAETDLDKSLLAKYYKYLQSVLNLNESYNKIFEGVEKYTTNMQLFEGGNAGHINHPFEILEFNFRDYYNIIEQVLDQSLLMTEKIDGMNIHATVINGQTVFSRNKSTILNPMTIEDMKEKWEGSPVQNIFVNGGIELSIVLQWLNRQQQERLFQNGRRWLNVEILDVNATNIIPYKESRIVIHDFRTFDQNQNKNSSSHEGIDDIVNAYKLAEQKNNFKYKVTGPIHIELQDEGVDTIKTELITDLGEAMRLYEGINEYTTIDEIILTEMKKRLTQMDYEDFADLFAGSEVGEDLLRRWVYDDKSFKSITAICKPIRHNKELYNYIRNFEKSKIVKDIINAILMPLIKIIVKLGNVVMEHSTNLVNSGSDEYKNKILDRANNAKDYVMANKDEYEDLLVVFDNIDTVHPSEGIVFVYYKGEDKYMLKLTGSFFWLNKVVHLKSRDTGESVFTNS